MRIKTLALAALAILPAVSCQEMLIERRADGRLSLHLESSPVVEVVTKSDAVSTDNFKVYVSSADETFEYIYKDMPAVVTVPVGRYVVSAENVSSSEAASMPDKWGQVRYYGISEEQEVGSDINPTEYSLTCTMVNTAVSVVFDENIGKHFKDYSVKAYTVTDRALDYYPSSSKVGYFGEQTLNYEFSGKYIEDSEPVSITGTKTLQPATHLHLTVKMSGQNGSFLKPEIVVDARCEDVYEEITVDPTDKN